MEELKDGINEEIYKEHTVSSREWGNLDTIRSWTDKETNLADCANKQGMATQTLKMATQSTRTHRMAIYRDSASRATTKTAMTSTDKWVKNLSGVPLTTAHVSLLGHGPNFAIAPRCPWILPHCCGAGKPQPKAL